LFTAISSPIDRKKPKPPLAITDFITRIQGTGNSREFFFWGGDQIFYWNLVVQHDVKVAIFEFYLNEL